MDRRSFISGGGLALAGLCTPLPRLTEAAAASDLRITRVRVFNPANATNLDGPLNLSEILVVVETNAGISGIGQGGTPDLLRYAASLLIGQDPFRIEDLWQRMYRSSIYPAGRERLNAVGALDCALWDIKGKALGQPVYQLLGGRTRDHVDCYKSYGLLRVDQARDEARRTMDEGYRAIRTFGIAGQGDRFDARRVLPRIVELCQAMRDGVGKDGDFIFDVHTRLDFADAARFCEHLEPLDPLFVEDPLHTMDDITLYARLRQRVRLPLAAGEQFGELRDGNLPLVEQGLIDYLRSSIPNVGGITGYRKLGVLCEAHSVGLVPHFTSPVGTAAVTHCLLSHPGMVMNEAYKTALPAYLKTGATFARGRLSIDDTPGLGLVFDATKATQVAEFTEARPPELYQGERVKRPDGSHLYL